MRVKPLCELRDLVQDPDASLIAIAETARRVRLGLVQATKPSMDLEPLLDELTVEVEALRETVRELEVAARSQSDPTNAVVAFLLAVRRVEQYGEVDVGQARHR